MPIYEYECPKCGVFEAVQKVSEKPLTCNPDCTEKGCPNKAERLVSASAFHLKGGGWYKTDYAPSGGSGGKKKASGDTAATGESKNADSTSGDAKSSDSKDSTPAKKGPCGSGCGCH